MSSPLAVPCRQYFPALQTYTINNGISKVYSEFIINIETDHNLGRCTSTSTCMPTRTSCATGDRH